jgi:hypothetical protein
MVSTLDDARLESLYNAEGFGGDRTMRARVIRELIDEIRDLRCHLAESEPSAVTDRRRSALPRNGMPEDMVTRTRPEPCEG